MFKTSEPIAIVNALTTMVEALIALAVGFGLDLSGEQVGLLMAVVVAVGNFAKTLWARGQVTPTSNPRNDAGQPLVPAAPLEPQQ